MMESLEECFASSLEVSCIPNNPNAPHPRFSQFKSKGRDIQVSQEERRLKFLERQKQKRYDSIKYLRGLAEGGNVLHEADMDEDEEKAEDMEWRTSQKKTRRKKYESQLMLSEWLVDIPEDLETNWFMVPCPEGKRSLVIASKGKTCSIARNGYLISTFPSLLPGGSYQHLQGRDFTILDCVFNIKERTFYVLDILCWKGHAVMDCETNFRFYWLNVKFSEQPEVGVCSKLNPYPFVPLPHFSCQKQIICDVMKSSMPFKPPLDGLLFYHTATHYTCGHTPLVGWLKAYMLPEMLAVPISEALMKLKPSNYTSVTEHLKVPLESVKKRQMKAQQAEEKETNEPPTI